ncbi:hypothetical protein GQS52_24780 [Streptomyces sp. SCUT-3]|nr:hypothetical protein GQS52_24780 [Streptomyces sp. SCUT-3]
MFILARLPGVAAAKRDRSGGGSRTGPGGWDAEGVSEQQLSIRFDPQLWLFLPPRRRRAEARPAPWDGTSSLGHVVQSLGVPLTETGTLTVDGRPALPSQRPPAGATVDVPAVRRPQALPVSPPRFLLDVHLGSLARRLRLVGVSARYSNDADDPDLVDLANEEGRILLTQDHGLLKRRNLHLGAYVRGSRPDDQLADVLERFAPPLAPWTRCTACDGPLVPVDKAEIAQQLRPGTRRTYDTFARCSSCGRPYWHGAHTRHLEAVVDAAARVSARSTG